MLQTAELEELFRDKFGFLTTTVVLDCRQKLPQHQLNSEVSKFMLDHDGPHRTTLLIVYYSGHGYTRPGKRDQLYISGYVRWRIYPRLLLTGKLVPYLHNPPTPRKVATTKQLATGRTQKACYNMQKPTYLPSWTPASPPLPSTKAQNTSPAPMRQSPPPTNTPGHQDHHPSREL